MVFRKILPLRLCWLLLALGLGAGVVAAAEQGARVGRALAANLVQLDDGRVVRLAGIRPPGDGEAAGRAQAALATLVEGHAVRLAPAARDRHGRLVAQVWRDDGLWLQGALLERGLVQLQTRPGEVARAAAMAARESAARDAGTGLWADGRFAVRPASQLDGAVASFQIVQGRVVRVAPTRHYVYLNFGADWRSDFTLRVAGGLARSLKRAGLDLEALAGREVEVRGYVLEAGGPLIELSHREQIRILPAPGADAAGS